MNPTKHLLLAMAIAPLVALAAGNTGNPLEDHGQPASHNVGNPGNPANVTRTIQVAMHDTMRFTPDKISVRAGDTVRFVVRNTGKVDHEMVIRTSGDLKAHAQMMLNMPMARHAEANQVSPAPGQQGAVVWKFDRPGTVVRLPAAQALRSRDGGQGNGELAANFSPEPGRRSTCAPRIVPWPLAERLPFFVAKYS